MREKITAISAQFRSLRAKYNVQLNSKQYPKETVSVNPIGAQEKENTDESILCLLLLN